MHRIILGMVLLVSCNLRAQAVSQSGGQPRQSPFIGNVTPRQLESTYLHGTVDVVVSTKEGFVLATDSRATFDHSHSDDAQKAFAVGNRAGCVIAGLIGSEMQMEGFRLRDAMGTHLASLSAHASRDNRPVSATDIAESFSFGLSNVAGLLLPAPQGRPGIVGAVSAVSISADGDPEWTTLYLPLDLRYDETGTEEYYSVGFPIYLSRPQTLGLRFDVQALGFPYVAEKMLKADRAANDPFSKSPIMLKFYDRKRSGHLDEFTLVEAVDLARELVRATIGSAPTEAGVGGPIDILTVTKEGVRWVERKETSAPFPPPYRFRGFFMEMTAGGQLLDGFECVRCKFRDVDFTYAGNGDVELLGPIFQGKCQLTLLPGARQRMPGVVDRLERTVAGKCTITESRQSQSDVPPVR